jgi:general secretion pathway protein F
MPDRRGLSLTEATRARLHVQLAALERAGVPPLQALDALDLPGEAQPRVRRAKGLLEAGRGLAEAGRISGLFTPMEAAVIASAVEGGSPARAHQRLGEQAEQRARHAKAMRARLMLPGMIALAALVLLPIPALASGALGVGAYVLRITLTVAGVAVVIALGREFLRRQAAAEAWPGRDLCEGIALAVPGMGPLLARVQVQRFVEYLGLLLECGLPAADAVPHAASTLRVQRIRADFDASVPLVQAGHSLTDVAIESMRESSAADSVSA